MTDPTSALLPPPQGFFRRLVYRVGLAIYNRRCARERHILGRRRQRTVGAAGHQSEVMVRTCMLCGAMRANGDEALLP